MNILLSNDDGINAKGIHVLADALMRLPDVNLYVCAPDRQRSCCGHALTMNADMFVKEHDPKEFNEKTVWAAECSGFPADCVRIGLFALRQKDVKIDLVCTGINMGSNYGTDIFYSGTLASAREATVCFTQAIAFSLASHESRHFEAFYDFVPQVVEKTYKKLPVTTILNVNIPDIPADQIKGLRICRQGPMDYSLDYRVKDNGAYFLDGDLVVGHHTDMNWDIVAGTAGYITLTPCELFPYSEESERNVAGLGITWNE